VELQATLKALRSLCVTRSVCARTWVPEVRCRAAQEACGLGETVTMELAFRAGDQGQAVLGSSSSKFALLASSSKRLEKNHPSTSP